jgi:hypothetical protein
MAGKAMYKNGCQRYTREPGDGYEWKWKCNITCGQQNLGIHSKKMLEMKIGGVIK